MPVQLGAGFTAPASPPAPTGDERRHMELLAELAALRITLHDLAQQPAPMVNVTPPDLRELLFALEQINIPTPLEGTDPRAIGEAVALALQANRVEVPDRTDEVLEELKRIGRKFGVALANSAPVVSNDISSNPARVLGQVEVTATPGLTDEQLRATRLPVSLPTDPTGRVAVRAQDGASEALDAGVIFSSGGTASTGTLNANAHATLTNPVGSGRRLYVQSWACHASVNAPVRYVLDGVSPAPIAPISSHSVVDTPPMTSIAEVRCGGGSVTGGAQMGAAHRTGMNAPLDKVVPIRVDPGHSLTIHFAAGGLDSQVSFAVAWREAAL